MAWNNQKKTTVSSSGGAATRTFGRSNTSSAVWGKPPYHSNTRTFILLLVLLAAAAVGVGAYFFFFGRAATPTAEKTVERKNMQMVDVEPSRPPKTGIAKKKPYRKRANSFVAKLAEGKEFTNEYGIVFNRRPTAQVSTNYIENTDQHLRKYFPNGVDCGLAGLISIEPGEDMLGGLPMCYQGKSFERRFLQSLETPIVTNDDDPGDIKALKSALVEMKKEMKTRHDEGEDLGEVLAQTFDELKQLFAYRENLEQTITELSKDANMSAEDLQDFVKAANGMLAERGIKPMTMPISVVARLRYLSRKNNREQTGHHSNKKQEK